jgi:hypothetical protein
MMMSEAKEPQGTSPKFKLVIQLIIGAFAGMVTSAGVLFWMEGTIDTGLSLSNEIAAVVGALYALIAVGVFIGAMSPALGEKYLNVEDADEIRDQRTMLLFSVVAMATFGGALILLAIAGPGGPISGEAALATAVALIAAGSWCGWKSYKASDELMLAVNVEGSALSFMLIFLVLGGWAAAAHTGVSVAPAPIDLLTLFYVISLLASFIAIGRRGMIVVR